VRPLVGDLDTSEFESDRVVWGDGDEHCPAGIQMGFQVSNLVRGDGASVDGEQAHVGHLINRNAEERSA